MSYNHTTVYGTRVIRKDSKTTRIAISIKGPAYKCFILIEAPENCVLSVEISDLYAFLAKPSMVWTEIQTYPVSGPAVSFLDALAVWTNKPHVVNRRLCGAKIVCQCKHTAGQIQHGLGCVPPSQQTHGETLEEPESQRLHTNMEILLQSEIERDHNRTMSTLVRDMIPKNIEKQLVIRELVLTDDVNMSVSYFTMEMRGADGSATSVVHTPRAYKIQLLHEPSRLSLQVHGSPDMYKTECHLGYTLPWLQETLMPKLSRWCTERELNTDITSLRLLSVDRYNTRYQQLKKKYGVPLVEKWPESTDPQKFVYEDVAIATYLLLLWEDDRYNKNLTDKQSFVDLGCGNGLLVYILVSEGHRGLGLDLRRRKIWDLYEIELNLVEQAVTPSDDNLFPTYDWLIGNHSDELTPWIPFMAARSSYECCYFVLPCCAWDFDAKFSHKETGMSQYRSYLNFVDELGQASGFNVEEDTLRIPSTKRVCFIGRSRSYLKGEEERIDKRRRCYIEERCRKSSTNESQSESQHHSGNGYQAVQETSTNITQASSMLNAEADKQCCCTTSSDSSSASSNCVTSSHSCSTTSYTCSCSITGSMCTPCTTSPSGTAGKRKWANDFKARSNVERPRNCISVSPEIKEQITHAVFRVLLQLDDQDNVINSETWNKGVSMSLGEVATMFDQQTLSNLKSECGGLQTLLRNHHHVFRVQGGKVSLRDWTTDDYDQHQQRKRRRKGRGTGKHTTQHAKTKLCYFFQYHPQGCPLNADECRFAHGEAEIRIDTKT